MKKVVYSIKKVRGNSDDKISGLGFLNEEGTLLCRCVSKTGKPYTRAFDDVEQHCFPVFGKENEYKGYETHSPPDRKTRKPITNAVWVVIPVKTYLEYKKLWRGCPF